MLLICGLGLQFLLRIFVQIQDDISKCEVALYLRSLECQPVFREAQTLYVLVVSAILPFHHNLHINALFPDVRLKLWPRFGLSKAVITMR